MKKLAILATLTTLTIGASAASAETHRQRSIIAADAAITVSQTGRLYGPAQTVVNLRGYFPRNATIRIGPEEILPVVNTSRRITFILPAAMKPHKHKLFVWTKHRTLDLGVFDIAAARATPVTVAGDQSANPPRRARVIRTRPARTKPRWVRVKPATWRASWDWSWSSSR